MFIPWGDPAEQGTGGGAGLSRTRYIVCDEDGALVLGTYDDAPRAGVLLSATDAYWEDHPASPTLFPTLRAAERAVERTKAYATAKRYSWGKQCRIFPVQLPR